MSKLKHAYSRIDTTACVVFEDFQKEEAMKEMKRLENLGFKHLHGAIDPEKGEQGYFQMSKLEKIDLK